MKKLLRVLAIVAVAVLGTALFFRAELTGLWTVTHLFDEDRIVHNFQHMDELFDTSPIEGGGEIFEFERGSYTLPRSFVLDGKTYDTEAYLAETMTTGLLILHDDKILLERYDYGHSAEETHIAWSVSKSFVSALIGIAVGEGHIRDIMQPVTDYVPELAGSGYDGVAIKDVLQMSSGVGFNEDYGDPSSDINRMGRSLGMGSSLLEFAATLKRARPPSCGQRVRACLPTPPKNSGNRWAWNPRRSGWSTEPVWKWHLAD